MTRFSSHTTSNFRSISLPSRIHPTTLRVEEELIKLKCSVVSSNTSSATNANTICSALLGLQHLYKSIDDFLKLPLITQSLSSSSKWADELLDRSVRFLDICGLAKDIVSECKENVRDLQSSLRRKKESVEKKYLSCRKKLKKDIKRSVSCLKQIEHEINGSDHPTNMDLDHHVLIVIRVLKEANSTSVMIFQLVLKFLSADSSNSKTNRWIMIKGRFGSEDDQKKEIFNELENVDAALLSSTCLSLIDHNKMIVNLEGSLENLENELEAMSRCLIRSRTTLLNVFSC